MSYNSLILNKLDADRYMANLLDKSLAGVQQQAVQQAHLIYSGVERLSWYSSVLPRQLPGRMYTFEARR